MNALTHPVLSRSSAPRVGQARAPRRAGRLAFTLIEVMLAVVIFSIVLVAMHLVFYGAVRLRNQTTDALQEKLPLQQTLDIMKRDLANMVMPGGTLFGELQTAQSGASSNLISSLSPVNDAVPGQSGPALFTASGVLQEGTPWGEVQRVAYYLAPPTNNAPGKDLIRSVTRNLLPIMSEQPELQPLLSGVQSLVFSFYDGRQWREYWDSTVETNRLPEGVKVQLQLVGRDSERSRPAAIELVVPLALQAGTNDNAQAEEGSL